MTLEVWFWLFYVLSLLFGFYVEYLPGAASPYWQRGVRHVVVFVLLGLLGLRVFGSPVK